MSDYKQITSNSFKALEKLFHLIYMNMGPNVFFMWTLYNLDHVSGAGETWAHEKTDATEKVMNLKKIFDSLMSESLLPDLFLWQILAH